LLSCEVFLYKFLEVEWLEGNAFLGLGVQLPSTCFACSKPSSIPSTEKGRKEGRKEGRREKEHILKLLKSVLLIYNLYTICMHELSQ
jgi:hypothetical protein